MRCLETIADCRIYKTCKWLDILVETTQTLLQASADRELRSIAEASRGLGRELVEDGGEIALVGVSDLVRDLGDRQVGFAKQGLGPLDAALDHVAMRCQARGLLERVGEMIGAHRQDRGDLVQR